MYVCRLGEMLLYCFLVCLPTAWSSSAVNYPSDMGIRHTANQETRLAMTLSKGSPAGNIEQQQFRI